MCNPKWMLLFSGYYVDDSERFGIVGFTRMKKLFYIEGKPKKSNSYVTGLYFSIIALWRMQRI